MISWVLILGGVLGVVVAGYRIFARLRTERALQATKIHAAMIYIADMAAHQRIDVAKFSQFANGELYYRTLRRCAHCAYHDACAEWLIRPSNENFPAFCPNADTWEALRPILRDDKGAGSPSGPNPPDGIHLMEQSHHGFNTSVVRFSATDAGHPFWADHPPP